MRSVKPFNLGLPDLDDETASDISYRPRPTAARGNRSPVGKRQRAYGDDINTIQLRPEYTNKFIKRNDKYEDEGVGGSTKLDAVMMYIRQWRQEAPEDKIIGKFSS